LGNAAKHSEAALIQVRLWEEDGLFVARIEDDGKGFDLQAVTENYSSRGSLGMVNMRERAELINGTLRLESEPGRGTAITLIVPLDKAGRRAAPNGAHS
jgi:signal transduction histidine kinase